MKFFLILSLLAFLGWKNVYGKVFDKCEFVRKLESLGVPRDQLGTWTCIANYESHFDTKATNKDTGDYGILQISHLYWCSDSNTPGGDCHTTCSQFLNDDINDDVACARHIFDVTAKQSESKNGFTAWTTYKKYCSGDNNSWSANCV